jgi:hypothetical protein
MLAAKPKASRGLIWRQSGVLLTAGEWLAALH